MSGERAHLARETGNTTKTNFGLDPLSPHGVPPSERQGREKGEGEGGVCDEREAILWITAQTFHNSRDFKQSSITISYRMRKTLTI